MKLLKVNNKYYHILHQFEVKFFDNVVMEYVINHNDEIIYFTNHDEVSEIEVRKYRNPEIKQSRLNHWNRALQHMTDYTRDNKIEKIITEPFVWKFA
jgi:hypothetical protein